MSTIDTSRELVVYHQSAVVPRALMDAVVKENTELIHTVVERNEMIRTLMQQLAAQQQQIVHPPDNENENDEADNDVHEAALGSVHDVAVTTTAAQESSVVVVYSRRDRIYRWYRSTYISTRLIYPVLYQLWKLFWFGFFYILFRFLGAAMGLLYPYLIVHDISKEEYEKLLKQYEGDIHGLLIGGNPNKKHKGNSSSSSTYANIVDDNDSDDEFESAQSSTSTSSSKKSNHMQIHAYGICLQESHNHC